jgi:DnaJ-class molecular chaperone
MSSKIEVCKTCNGTGIEYDGAGHTCTACNGIAAPVVEHQPVAEVIATGGPHDREDRVLVELQAELPPIGTKVYAAPPELAELQATIAQLTAEIERLKPESFEELYNTVIDERDAAQKRNKDFLEIMRSVRLNASPRLFSPGQLARIDELLRVPDDSEAL